MKKEEIMLNTQLPEPTQFEIDSFNKYKASPKYIVKYKQYLLNNSKNPIHTIKRYGFLQALKMLKNILIIYLNIILIKETNIVGNLLKY
jgi:hypothetical protein